MKDNGCCLLEFGEIVDETMHQFTSIRDTNQFSDLGGREVKIPIPRLIKKNSENYKYLKMKLNSRIAFLQPS
jgi:hypothetical protein